MFCEDDDLHLRYKLAGFEHKVSSAHVYHFVSKTSRSTRDYQKIDYIIHFSEFSQELRSAKETGLK